ncbi:vitelline membrane outer layer protein 1 homolog [Electrophorus electricus]|uniref:vitelline membrane outer layer protein 1 homolog n=1 Tax=Electrophorus electricus TaxID=8005 RepID=UPI0015CFB820|nr:vitelline membrane outer layer protein 1 homolog [Electrophorus electricus]
MTAWCLSYKALRGSVCVCEDMTMAFTRVLALCFLALVGSAQCGSVKNPFVIRSGTSFASRPYSSLLTVPNGEQFGLWTWPEMCPDNFFAVGFSLRVETNQYGGDDTALNGIRLFCGQNGDRSFLYTVESNTGYFGEWTDPQWCPSGTLVSFQLRVETHRGMFGDDTAVNNIRFRCSSNPTLEGQGMPWGDYSHWSPECSEGGICGIETKMEPYQGGLDDSALNDVRFHCCSRGGQ